MKKFLSIILSTMMLVSAVPCVIGTTTLAAEASLEFCTINKGGKAGFVDNKPTGNLEVVKEDGKDVLKFSANKSAEYAGNMVNLEGLGFSKLGITYDTHRYMSIEYKYVTTNPVYSGAFGIQLCNSNKVFQNGAAPVNGTNLIASGKWETAYFDLTAAVDGRLAQDKETHTIQHIQLRPFGNTKGNALDAGDVVYIGKITFSEKNLEPNGITKPVEESTSTPAAPAAPATPEASAPSNDFTVPKAPETLGEVKGASPKLLGSDTLTASGSKVFVGTVDKKDTGLFEKVTVDGRELARFVPNPKGADYSMAVSLDAYGLSGRFSKAPTYEEYSFISIEYFYAAENPSYSGSMGVQLANSNKIFQSSGSRITSQPIVANKWDVAYFTITDAIRAKLKTDMTEHVLNHIQFFPYGDTKTANLTSKDVMYIGDVILHKENPNPKEAYTVSFSRDAVGVKGEDMTPMTVKKGEDIVLPDCPWTFEGSSFNGWVDTATGITYKVGDKVTATGDEDLLFAASWKEVVDSGFFNLVVEYASINNGIVDNVKSATVEKVTEDGLSAIKVTPNPETLNKDGKPEWIALENYGVSSKVKIDLDLYKYASVTYKYSTPSPKAEVTAPYISLTRNSGMFKNTGMAFKLIEGGEVVPNKWTTALYELPDLSEIYTDPGAVHMLNQFHLQPYGNTVRCNHLTSEDVIFVQTVTFHKEKPAKAVITVPYITGFEDGSFGLGKSMTRAQACTVVARLVAGGDANVTASQSAFADVPSSEWFAKYVTYCEAKGLLKSYSGNFQPNKDITRAEFVELVYNIGLLKDAGKNGTFTDVDASHPRAEVVSAAGKAGLVNGYANGDGTFSFKPDNTISREEVVTVINNAYGRKSDKTALVELGYKNLFTDVDSEHWAYPAIIDASVIHFAFREGDESFDSWLYSELSSTEQFSDEDYAAAEAKLLEVDALTEKRIAEIRATKSADVTGKKYYFAADGNDANDGLSPEKPKKTLAAASTLALSNGDGVFFKRGDIFRGQLITKSGVTYSAYGEGEKPGLYSSPANYAGAQYWEETEVPNVWKLKVPVLHDVGLAVFNEGEAWSEKRIKGREDFKAGKLEELDKDLLIWHDVSEPTNVSGYLYLRSDKGNPGERFNSIELNVRANTISVKANNVTIDNLCIKYTGAHGVGSGGVKGLKVQNCEFGFIGGSWFRTDTLSRYGNAVEIYGAVDGYVVDNCYIYQVYDAGVTHQLTQAPEQNCIMADVHYTNNVITYTSYPVEYFIAKPNPGVSHLYDGLEISGNIIRNTGYGFGDQRPDKTAAAGIKSWNTYNAAQNFVMNNNIFDRSKYRLIQLGADSPAWLPTMDGNIYIQYEGAQFGNIGNGDVLADAFLESYVNKQSKDANAKVYVLPKNS